MAHEYLLKEYEQCFEQVRFYDKRQANTLKYLFSLTFTIATAYFAIYKLPGGPPDVFIKFQVVVSGLVSIVTVLLYVAALENRLYFAVAARQVNAIREYFLEIEAKAGGFSENRMWTGTDMPAVHRSSLHTALILGAALISSLFVGAFGYAFGTYFGSGHSLIVGALAGFAAFVAEALVGPCYLSHLDKTNLNNTKSSNTKRKTDAGQRK